jgi:hypothetical protein
VLPLVALALEELPLALEELPLALVPLVLVALAVVPLASGLTLIPQLDSPTAANPTARPPRNFLRLIS